MSSEPLLQPQAPTPLLAEPKRPNVAPEVAFNRAYIESLVTNTPDTLPQRAQIQQEQNVLDEAIRVVSELVESKQIVSTGELEGISELPVDQQVERLQFMLAKQDMNKASPRNVALMLALSQNPEVSVQSFNEIIAEIPTTQLVAMKDQFRESQQARLRQEFQSLLERTGAEGTGEAIGDFAVGEMIPFYSVLSRFNLSNELLETIKPNADMGLRGFFTGEVRQEIRNALVEMTPEERLNAVREMVNVIEEMERDPNLGFTMTDYNIRETFENLLTEDLISGSEAGNSFDRWIGNLEVALGLAGSAWLLAKVGGASVAKTLSATRGLPTRQAAEVVGNNDYIASFHKALSESDIAKRFGVTRQEVVAAQFPRPEVMADDVAVLTPGTKDLLVRQARIRDRILTNTDDVTGGALSVENRMSRVKKEIADLDLADQMEIMPAMSRIEVKPNDTGYVLTATIGKTAKEGFDDLEQVVTHLKTVDADLQRFDVMRRTSSGTLESVFRNPRELKDFLEEGVIPKDNPYLPAGVRLTDLSDDQFLQLSKELGTELSEELLTKEAARRAGAPIKEEYFLTYRNDYSFHPVDKAFLNPGAINNGTLMPEFMVAPNAKFGDEIYSNVARMWLRGMQLDADLELMFKPYYALGNADRRVVNQLYEWQEAFAKETGKAPKVTDFRAQYPDLTEKQLRGLFALRTGQDTMYELLNRRLYREFQSQGFVTARPRKAGLPVFHGKRLTREEALKERTVYNPVDQSVNKVAKEDINALYDQGGSILKNDLPIDADSHKVSNILINNSDYRAGELSTQVLNYHPGYSTRFYEDPYVIIKKSKKLVDGKLQDVEEAIRMSPTAGDARAFVTRSYKGAKPLPDGTFQSKRLGDRFEIRRVRDINQTESAFLQRQTLQQEGRLFWDERNFNRLKDTSGNMARIMDPAPALERATALVAREVTMSDTLKSLENAWKGEFMDLLPRKPELYDNMGSMIKELEGLRRTNTVKELNKRYDKAIRFARYIDFMEGTGDAFAPAARKMLINLAGSLERFFGTGNAAARTLEKWGESFDPIKTMRSVPFNLFMRFRPARQYLLQSAQIGFIAPLDPTYVASGKIFMDRIALGSGLSKFRNLGFDDGFSTKNLSSLMGVSQAEFRKIVKEFDRAGLINAVDVHAFKGGVKRFDKVGAEESFRGSRKAWNYVADQFQQGFDQGEANNVLFSWLMALRRFQKSNNLKVKDITKEQWDKIAIDGSNLSLAMIRPNDFRYQRGALSLATQFMSFQNKALLAMLGQNPAIKGKDTWKLFLGTQLMYGGNMFGARNFYEGMFSDLGLLISGNEPIGPNGESIIDMLAGGAVETIINELGNITYGEDQWQDLDLSFMAPGIDITRIRTDLLEAAASGIGAEVILGPFGSIGAGFVQAVNDVHKFLIGPSEFFGPADKIYAIAHLSAKELLPQYNDIAQAHFAKKLGFWQNQAGDTQDVEAAMNDILARAVFGIRSRQYTSYYDVTGALWESKEQVDHIVRENQKFLSKMFNMWTAGEVTREEYMMGLYSLSMFMDDWPEGERLNILERSLKEDFDGRGSILDRWASNEGAYVNPDVRRYMANFLKEHNINDPEVERVLLEAANEAAQSLSDAEAVLRDQIQERNRPE